MHVHFKSSTTLLLNIKFCCFATKKKQKQKTIPTCPIAALWNFWLSDTVDRVDHWFINAPLLNNKLVSEENSQMKMLLVDKICFSWRTFNVNMEHSNVLFPHRAAPSLLYYYIILHVRIYIFLFFSHQHIFQESEYCTFFLLLGMESVAIPLVCGELRLAGLGMCHHTLLNCFIWKTVNTALH